MKKFEPSEITRFLQAVDKHLTETIEIRVIGGAAAALSFGAQQGTLDIDMGSLSSANIDITTAQSLIDVARKRAAEETGLDIPMQRVTVWDAPADFEERLESPPLPRLTKLRIVVPERYDWALMKIVRLDAKDIEHIKEVHARLRYDKRVFLDRFLTEMKHVEPRWRLVTIFVVMMEELYGKADADRMEARIRATWPNTTP